MSQLEGVLRVNLNFKRHKKFMIPRKKILKIERRENSIYSIDSNLCTKHLTLKHMFSKKTVLNNFSNTIFSHIMTKYLF